METSVVSSSVLNYELVVQEKSEGNEVFKFAQEISVLQVIFHLNLK